jgi:hypothetical protein
MVNSQFNTAISAPRFTRYLSACNYHQERAEKLYRLNLRFSQKMYAVVGVFEVILRNSIDRHYQMQKGPLWLEEAVMHNGYLEIFPELEKSYHTVQEAIQQLGLEYTHDRLIARLGFGFWAYQFSNKEYAASGNTLLQIFPNKPYGIRQKDIFKDLIKINKLRNRIAHYEPICFDSSTDEISSIPIQRRYELVLKILSWLGYNPKKILYGIDSVMRTAQEMNLFRIGVL